MTAAPVARARRALTLLAAALALLAAPGLAGPARPADAPRVVLLTSCDALNFICPGFLTALKRTGVAGKVVSPDPREDPETTLGLLARGGYDLVIADFTWRDVVATVAPRFPGARFALMDVRPAGHPANVQGVVIQPRGAAFLAGWLAARMEQRRPGRDVVGAVGGFPVPSVVEFIDGYRRGARYAAPSVTVLTGYSKDFTDPTKCEAVARRQIARGAGVVFDVAGGCGPGTLRAARAAGVLAVGVDRDRSALGPFILTSVVKRYDAGFAYFLRQVRDGEIRANGSRVMGLRNGGAGLGRLSPRVPDDLRAELATLRRRVIARGIPAPTR